MKSFLTLDRRLFNTQAMENVKLAVQHPIKDNRNNPLFIQDMPWEIRTNNGHIWHLLTPTS